MVFNAVFLIDVIPKSLWEYVLFILNRFTYITEQRTKYLKWGYHKLCPSIQVPMATKFSAWGILWPDKWPLLPYPHCRFTLHAHCGPSCHFWTGEISCDAFFRLCELSIQMQISRKWFELETWYQLITNRKWPMVDRMMTSSMTTRDRERSRSWSQYL